MKKRVLSLVLALALACALLPTVALAAEEEFVIDEDGVLTEYNGRGGDVVIPDGVTSIGNYAFKDRSMTSVTIPDTVTTIGEYAFHRCRDLTSVTIPDSVTSIGKSAFDLCDNMTSVTIGNGVTSIGVQAFYDCRSLTSVTIPDNVTSIGGNAFTGSSLTSVTIPDSVTDFDHAFSSCRDLTSVTIGNGVTSIGWRAFSNCTSLTSITIPGNVRTIMDTAFLNCDSLTSVTIDNGVTEIERSAFEGCTSLTSVTIPDSVRLIELEAFKGCTALASVAVPYRTSYSTSSFPSTTEVTQVGEYFHTVYNGVLDDYKGPGGDVVIPEDVTSIDKQAFRNNKSLTSITIPGNVRTIRENAFSGCTALTSVTMGNGVTKIERSAFEGCTSLTSVTIPDSVAEIDIGAFADCTALKSVGVPYRAVVQYGAFPSTTKVTRVGADYFDIQDGVVKGYRGRGGDVVIPKGVTAIGGAYQEHYAGQEGSYWVYGPFQRKTNITSITIPSSVTRIGEQAFQGCTNLDSVYISDMDAWRRIKFGSDCFTHAYNLYLNGKLVTDLVIPDGTTSIGYGTFSACKSLTSVTIPASVTSLGSTAFAGCTGLTDVYYGGTKAQWKEIQGVDSFFQTSIYQATLHYNLADPTPEPAVEPQPIETIVPTVPTAYASTQTVQVDGKPVTFNAYALKDANGYDTNYIKLRDVADVLNGSAAQFQVGWDGSITITTNAAYTRNGSEMIQNFSGNQSYTVNTSPVTVNGVTTDLEAITLTDANGGGYTYFKLRDLGAALGFNVSWDAQTGIVIDPNTPYNPAD